MSRLFRALVVVAFAAATTFGAGATAQTDWRASVKALLQRRATAVLRHDGTAFEDTMRFAPDAYKAAERSWLSRLGALPLGSYSLQIDDQEFGDLARPQDARLGEEVHVLQVKQRIGLRGYDDVTGTGPSDEDVFLTVVRKGSSWSVAGDTSVEDLGLLSDRNLWDFGDIDTVTSNGVMIVFHPAQRPATATVMREAQKARAHVRSAWPYPWNAPIVVLIPSSVDELARILQTTFDLSSFVAFAASSVDRSAGWGLVGNRVYLHWDNFRRYQESFQQRVLSHEFTHLATRSLSGPLETAVMEEGIAQFYGEDGGRQPDVMRTRVRRHSLPGSLVPDWYFTAGPDDDIHLAYEESVDFMRYLAKRFGHNAPANAYHALGGIDHVSPGTWRYHLDRVTVGLFHQPFSALERGWFDSALKELS